MLARMYWQMHWYNMIHAQIQSYSGGLTCDMGTDIADIWVTPSDAWTDTWCTDILKQRRAPSTLREVCRDRDKQTLPGTTKYSHRERGRELKGQEGWRRGQTSTKSFHWKNVERIWHILAQWHCLTASVEIRGSRPFSLLLHFLNSMAPFCVISET